MSSAKPRGWFKRLNPFSRAVSLLNSAILLFDEVKYQTEPGEYYNRSSLVNIDLATLFELIICGFIYTTLIIRFVSCNRLSCREAESKRDCLIPLIFCYREYSRPRSRGLIIFFYQWYYIILSLFLFLYTFILSRAYYQSFQPHWFEETRWLCDHSLIYGWSLPASHSAPCLPILHMLKSWSSALIFSERLPQRSGFTGSLIELKRA